MPEKREEPSLKANEERGGNAVTPELPTPPPPPSPPHPFYPTASNAICTANGGHFARARRWTKTLPDPWCMGALRGAILGDVAATPKMAGLAYEDGTGSVRLCTLQETALA